MATNKADILALAKAGFSAKQIATILNGDLPSPTPTSLPQPSPENKTKNDDENKSVNMGGNMDANAINMLNQKFDQMIQLMQAQNLANSQQPKQETADDIIASIINPNGGNK